MTRTLGRLTIPASIAEITTDDSTIVMRLDSAAFEPLQLSGSASTVWRALRSGAQTLSETVEACSGETGEAPGKIEGDVAQFLGSLIARGLVITSAAD
ncbi:hypothetical protein B7R54_03220 [Subtercola boreus]|uniref:PqqD family protein n=1 Tax=Subtercola boreus TaxID=120213 RepID=A0A3E0VEI9_9MICO|nr:PqqD family protein [Subtercola boreus]RFA08346.1 hypothetical protein B7R54_03220 [Subtercola boreus]TQL54751.1 coenzyme PQQ synthesis protein D (PqqD) [Subtercola boreus]